MNKESRLTKAHYIIIIICTIITSILAVPSFIHSCEDRAIKSEAIKRQALIELSRKFFSYGKDGLHKDISIIFADTIDYYSYGKKHKSYVIGSFRKGKKYKIVEFDLDNIDKTFTLRGDLSSKFDLTEKWYDVRIKHVVLMDYVLFNEKHLISKIKEARIDTTINIKPSFTYGRSKGKGVFIREKPSLEANKVKNADGEAVKLSKGNLVQIINTINNKKSNEGFLDSNKRGIKIIKNGKNKYYVKDVYDNTKIWIDKGEVKIINGWYYIKNFENNIVGYVCKDFIKHIN